MERFLGRARNSQGELLTPASTLYVCVHASLTLSLLFSPSLCLLSLVPPLLLPVCPQPSPGESIAQQADTLVSALCRRRLASSLRHCWGSLVPVLSPQTIPLPEPLNLLPRPPQCCRDPPARGRAEG